MIIGGLQKTSLIDFPGKISCVVFLSGCNFDCPYCHNPDLARGNPGLPEPVMDLDQLLGFLGKRRGLIDGVVLTGGEPTLQPDLPAACAEIKSLGFSVKVDTNGSRPDIVGRLLQDRLVDFLAMDIKTDPDRYPLHISKNSSPSSIRASIRQVLLSKIPHEFRTTCVHPIVDMEAVHVLAELLQGAQCHVLQRVQHDHVNVLHPEFFDEHDWFVDEATLRNYQSRIAETVGTCLIR
ncbi:MAG: anaerobic ribonucleoside-triphosphate reductase activating protein [Bacteroidales bacterium]